MTDCMDFSETESPSTSAHHEFCLEVLLCHSSLASSAKTTSSTCLQEMEPFEQSRRRQAGRSPGVSQPAISFTGKPALVPNVQDTLQASEAEAPCTTSNLSFRFGRFRSLASTAGPEWDWTRNISTQARAIALTSSSRVVSRGSSPSAVSRNTCCADRSELHPETSTQRRGSDEAWRELARGLIKTGKNASPARILQMQRALHDSLRLTI